MSRPAIRRDSIGSAGGLRWRCGRLPGGGVGRGRNANHTDCGRARSAERDPGRQGRGNPRSRARGNGSAFARRAVGAMPVSRHTNRRGWRLMIRAAGSMGDVGRQGRMAGTVGTLYRGCSQPRRSHDTDQQEGYPAHSAPSSTLPPRPEPHPPSVAEWYERAQLLLTTRLTRPVTAKIFCSPLNPFNQVE